MFLRMDVFPLEVIRHQVLVEHEKGLQDELFPFFVVFLGSLAEDL